MIDTNGDTYIDQAELLAWHDANGARPGGSRLLSCTHLPCRLAQPSADSSNLLDGMHKLTDAQGAISPSAPGMLASWQNQMLNCELLFSRELRELQSPWSNHQKCRGQGSGGQPTAHEVTLPFCDGRPGRNTSARRAKCEFAWADSNNDGQVTSQIPFLAGLKAAFVSSGGTPLNGWTCMTSSAVRYEMWRLLHIACGRVLCCNWCCLCSGARCSMTEHVIVVMGRGSR